MISRGLSSYEPFWLLQMPGLEQIDVDSCCYLLHPVLISHRVEAISKSSVEDLTAIFSSTKSAKSVLSTAKRVIKKRDISQTGVDDNVSTASKRRRSEPFEELINPDSLAAEESLLLPTLEISVADLEPIVLFTNRAPLVLAFAVVLLSYTYPHQPLSSRLSLAQAVVSANSRSKAVAIGLESGPSAEAEGWGDGQPRIKVMGREIRVLRRWNYERPKATEPGPLQSGQNLAIGQPSESDEQETWTERTVPLWGLDTEKLRDSNKSKGSPGAAPTSSLPIFTAQAARNYLLRSFSRYSEATDASPTKKSSLKDATTAKEHNAALLLRALDILFASWKDTLSRDELDKRAWSWYVAVRPDVETGQKGWGEKGKVELSQILKMRKAAEKSEESAV